MAAKPKTLSPLEQRLALYGFAFIQIAPGNSIDPGAWGVPDLQLIPPRHKQWETILGRCGQFDSRKNAPAISPSLKSLTRVRRQYPNRPLVYCQTAFERKPKPQTLMRLIFKTSPITCLLTRTDGTHPLFWISHWPRPEPVWLEALKGRASHPLAVLAQSQRKKNPHHQIWLREDGLLVAQMDLFHNYRHALRNEVFSPERVVYDDQFKNQFKGGKGTTYVFSQKTATLKWFERDCKRLLGNRVFCWWYPALPDSRDPLIHLVLVKDAAIRFQYLPRSENQIHCDNESENVAFRDFRVKGWASCDWKSHRVPEARAVCEIGGNNFVFWETKFGWISQETCQMPGKDRSAAFQKRAQTLALIFQTRPFSR